MFRLPLILTAIVVAFCCMSYSNNLNQRLERQEEQAAQLQAEAKKLDQTPPLSELRLLDQRLERLKDLPAELARASLQQRLLARGAQVQPAWLWLHRPDDQGQSFSVEAEAEAGREWVEAFKDDLSELSPLEDQVTGELP